MHKQNKIFCGSGKVKSDKWLKITINPDKIQDYIREYNGNKYVKLDINIKSEPDKYGKDIEVTVDTWQPDKKKDKPMKIYENNVEKDLSLHDIDPATGEDLPF